MFSIKKKAIPYYALCILFVAIPFGGVLPTIGIFLWILSILLFSDKSVWKRNLSEGKYFFIPLLMFFLVHAIGLIWTDNIENGLSKIEHKLSFLIIPLFFPFMSLNKKKIIFLFKLFSISCLSIVIISFFDFLYVTLTAEEYIILGEKPKGNRPGDVYQYLANHFLIVNIHRTYFSVYIVTSILFILFNFQPYIQFQRKEYKFFGTLSLFVMVIAVVCLQSKAGILILLISVIGFLIMNTIKSFKVIIGTILIITASIFFSKKIIHNRLDKFLSEIEYIMSPESDDQKRYTKVLRPGSAEIRYMVYKSSLQLIAKKPFIGYGTGSVKDVLRVQNEENRFTSIAHLNYGPHSQFLAVFLGFGILGIFSFLVLFILPTYKAYKNGEYFVVLTLLAFVLASITESVLNRQEGIIPAALFIAVLSGLVYQNKNLNIKP